jgi:putative membrane protein
VNRLFYDLLDGFGYNQAMQLLLRFLVSAIALYLTVRVGQALHIEKFWVAPGLAGAEGLVVTALALGIVNAVLRPIVRALTLPLTCLTFGLFALVVNAVMFWLASQVVPSKFHVAGWEAPLFGSVVMSLVSGLLNALVISKREKRRS